MALTSVTNGTLSLSGAVGTETNMATTTPGAATTYVYAVDVAALASGEVLFIRVYVFLLASGTERMAYFGSVVGGQDTDLIQYSVPIPVNTGTSITIRGTLHQKNGTGRSFPWQLYSL